MNDFEEFNVTPELTLDPFQEEKKETPQIYQEAEPETPEIVLTPEEKNMVSAFAEKIDLANSNMPEPRRRSQIFQKKHWKM